MKVAIIHSFYRSNIPSGENQAVIAQMNALIEAGIEATLVSDSTDNHLGEFGFEIKSGLKLITGVGNSPVNYINKLNPDVIHVHNLFPNYSTRWISSETRPIITTLHNFRSICANGLLNRDGVFCDLCPSTSVLNAVAYGCYSQSHLKSIPLAISTRRAGLKNRLLQKSKVILSLSERSADMFSKYLRRDIQNKMVVVPNFYSRPEPVIDSEIEIDPTERMPWVYAGRLSREKGVVSLIEGWPNELSLTIFGTGPLEKEVIELISDKPNISFRGVVSSDQLYEEIRATKRFVFPSNWAEGAPIVFLQALAAGAITVATNGNTVSDIISEYDVGVIVSDSRLIGLECLKLEQKALRRDSEISELFRTKFTQEAWLENILPIYCSLISNATKG